MCTVLTNAPLPTENRSIIMPKWGECTVRKDICPKGVLHGLRGIWKIISLSKMSIMGS